MAILYQIFSNGGSGAPINFGTPIATTSGTTYTTGALAASSDYRFAVRAVDASSGLSELNTQASVRITIDGSGRDVTQTPNTPFALVARPLAQGGCAVKWAYRSTGQAAAPTNFLVYLTAGSAPVLGAPAATVVYQAGVVDYGCTLGGLVDSTSYTVSVVAQGAAAYLQSLCASTAATGDSTAPLDVEALAAVSMP